MPHSRDVFSVSGVVCATVSQHALHIVGECCHSGIDALGYTLADERQICSGSVSDSTSKGQTASDMTQRMASLAVALKHALTHPLAL
jgi:hypothetical protein